MAVIIIAVTWRWTGYNMVFYLAALQNIDKSIYESARDVLLRSVSHREFPSLERPFDWFRNGYC